MLSIDSTSIFAAIRIADSAFPTGGFAFSSGLESSYLDGHVSDEADLLAVVQEQLLFRWQTFDRVFLHRYYASPSAAMAVQLDNIIESMTTVDRLRSGSRRAGAGLLSTFAKLDQAECAAYWEGVLAGSFPGHLTVVQAVGFHGIGLDLRMAETVSAWHLVSGLTGAALRLGIVGHLAIQRVLAALVPVLGSLLDDRLVIDEPISFSTLSEIAAARRMGNSARLFAT